MLLSNLILIPLIGSLLVLFIPSQYKETIKVTVLSFSLAEFLLSLMMWMSFDNSSSRFQFVEAYNWIESSNIIFYLGVDGISLFFILLTTLLIPICLLASWDAIKFNEKEYFIAFLAMEALVIAVFCVLDIILFYVFFESVLIPMFIIIGVWGSRERRIRAAYMFFLYTLLGSVLMLLAILYIYYQVGTTDYQILLTTTFDPEVQKLLWLAFFASFAVKVPMLPVHIWLPEAHVEAPNSWFSYFSRYLIEIRFIWFLTFLITFIPLRFCILHSVDLCICLRSCYLYKFNCYTSN